MSQKPLKSLDKPDKTLLEKRGEGTRYALILAGLELFGEHGLKSTSTRMLADAADCNIAAIAYYFGSKEGLYAAVMSYIVERISQNMGKIAYGVEDAIKEGNLTQDQARNELRKILLGVAKLFVESEEPKAWARIVTREQARPTEAFDILYEGNMKRKQFISSRLVGLSIGIDPDSIEAKVRAHALTGQIFSFLVSRESLLRNLQTDKFKPEHIAVIHRVIESHIEACLQLPPLD